MLNKRAQAIGDQLSEGLTILLLMAIIAVGLWAGIGLAFGSGYDVRQADADSLLYQTARCFSISSLSNIQSDFYKTCGLNQTVLEQNRLILKICENRNANDCLQEKNNFLVSAGAGLQVECTLEGGKSNNAYPKCESAEIVKDGHTFTLITGSNQMIRRVSG